jgi:hypothetical protein
VPLYFAYGSNLSSARLRARVGDLPIVGRAVLADFEHTFSKLGADGTGKGNVRPRLHDVVHGVLYDLSHAQLRTLAGFEGGYRRTDIDVRRLRPDAPVVAVTFIALDPGPAPPPSDAYIEHYARGIDEHGIPRTYARRVLGPAFANFVQNRNV